MRGPGGEWEEWRISQGLVGCYPSKRRPCYSVGAQWTLSGYTQWTHSVDTLSGYTQRIHSVDTRSGARHRTLRLEKKKKKEILSQNYGGTWVAVPFGGAAGVFARADWYPPC